MGMMKRNLYDRLPWLILVVGSVGLAGGCSSTLETGYQPRPLGGSSAEVRRGYYAQPFTPEAKKAKDYQQEFGTMGTSSGRQTGGIGAGSGG
jgi:hypothetical protein